MKLSAPVGADAIQQQLRSAISCSFEMPTAGGGDRLPSGVYVRQVRAEPHDQYAHTAAAAAVQLKRWQRHISWASDYRYQLQ